MISDITIIGGGVIGLLTAREFFLAGANVTVIEKNQLGQESSWAGGGILLPLYPWRQADAISRLVIQSLQLYPTLAGQLKLDTGLDPEWNPCGILITKNPDLNAATAWCDRFNINYQAAGAEFFTDLHTSPEHPLWLPQIAQARNPRLVKSLRQDLLNKGVAIHEHTEVIGVTLEGNKATAITTSTGQFAVKQLVITAGAWTGQLFQQFFPHLADSAPQIAPVKGQMLLFQGEANQLPYMVLDGDHYLIPRLDGKILVGSTVESDAFNKTTSSAAQQRLSAFATDLLPALAKAPLIKHWAGLRPGTEHGIPYIDRHPEISNLAINAGHFRNGLAMGPASAQLLVDLVLNKETAVPAQPYALSGLH